MFHFDIHTYIHMYIPHLMLTVYDDWHRNGVLQYCKQLLTLSKWIIYNKEVSILSWGTQVTTGSKIERTPLYKTYYVLSDE